MDFCKKILKIDDCSFARQFKSVAKRKLSRPQQGKFAEPVRRAVDVNLDVFRKTTSKPVSQIEGNGIGHSGGFDRICTQYATLLASVRKMGRS